MVKGNGNSKLDTNVLWIQCLDMDRKSQSGLDRNIC